MSHLGALKLRGEQSGDEHPCGDDGELRKEGDRGDRGDGDFAELPKIFMRGEFFLEMGIGGDFGVCGLFGDRSSELSV